MSKILIFGALLAGMSGVAAYTLHGPCGSCHKSVGDVTPIAATPKVGGCCEKSPGTVCCAACPDCDDCCCIEGFCPCCGLSCEECCVFGGCGDDCCAPAPAAKVKAKCCDGCCEKK